MLAITLLIGCGKDGPEETPAAPPERSADVTGSEAPATQPGPSATNPFGDSSGDREDGTVGINRIISLAPAITQTLLHLGMADKLVAIDNNSVILEGVPAGLPVVDLISPDVELLITLNADMLLSSGMTAYDESEPLKPLSEAGVYVVMIPSSTSIESIIDDIIFISALVGRHYEGAAIVEELEEGIRVVQEALSGAEKKKVYFEIAAAPAAYSFGSGTFMNEMIEIAGGENIFADIDGWLAASEEQVIIRNPDVIFTNVNYIDSPVEEILGLSSLKGVAAVENNQVYFVDNYSSSLDNEYILTAIHQMAAAMHPDLWKNG